MSRDVPPLARFSCHKTDVLTYMIKLTHCINLVPKAAKFQFHRRT
jgi:hypothetical protein